MPVMSKLRRKAPEREREPAVDAERVDDTMPIGQVTWRQRVSIGGRVRSVRVQPWAGVATLEAVLVDGTGGISVVFLGRREVAGVHPGAKMAVEGMVGAHAGRLAILNPDYRLLVADTEP